jgi:CheY-like chemotaxis protein
MKLGCQVDVASNGLIAAEMMGDKLLAKYDIILLDLEMPIKGNTATLDSKTANLKYQMVLQR